MLNRQRGVLNLFWVAVGSALFAALAMAALFSMRYERNLFAEGASWAVKRAGASGVVDGAAMAAKSAAGQADGALRKCVIGGKTVVSNTDCLENNPTSQKLQNHATSGIDAPKAAPKGPGKDGGDKGPDAGAPTLRDKMIEKQLQ